MAPNKYVPSRKHAYIILTSLTQFLCSKTGLQGYSLFFLFLINNIYCGYSLEPPRQGDSNEYLQSMFWVEIWKISKFFFVFFFYLKTQFLEVKFSIHLNRAVFVMKPLKFDCISIPMCNISCKVNLCGVLFNESMSSVWFTLNNSSIENISFNTRKQYFHFLDESYM